MDEATQAFKKATEVDPKFADAFFMEGRALMAKLTLAADGKVVAAPGTTEALESYLKLEPNGKYAGEAQAMLQTLQGQVQTEVHRERRRRH
jgi:cytochrome c-type biogenesis protein CcmH/NrfG